MKNKVIIVGSGHAGGMVCTNLIRHGFEGEITIIGDEEYIPYARPELSKGLLDNSVDENRIFLRNSNFYKDNGVNLISNTTIINIDRNKQKIFSDDNNEFQYDYLVLATGSSLRKIESSCNQEKILYLRKLQDSKNIKNIFDKDKSDIGIIGSGYIGLELASVAAKKNHNVYVFDSEERVLKRSTCLEVSEFIRNKHENNGVNFFLNTKIIDIEDHNTYKKIIYENGSNIDVNEVIVGIGVKPNISLAIEADIKCDDGIIVDEDCRTSDHKIFAVGDCTYAYNKLYDKFFRIESVHNAIKQADTAASAIANHVRPNYETPWFWTNQYDLKIFFTGISENHDEKIILGSIKNESFSICYFKNQQLIAVDSINRNRDYIQAKKIIGNDSYRYAESSDLENTNLKDIFYQKI